MLIRKINKHTINYFLIKLSYKTWEAVFSTDDVNKMFNAEALVVAIKEIGLEVNAGKTKYMVMS